MIGWVLPELEPEGDLDKVRATLQAISDWCQHRLSDDLAAIEQADHIRILSVVAVEAEQPGMLENLKEIVFELSEQSDDNPIFQLGELDQLEGVQRRDLKQYFDDRQVCPCDDRYRGDFPKLLLGGRKEMTFDEAVRAIRRGHPNHWGNLYRQLQEMTENKQWPPENYDPDFWQNYNG